jgi:NAD-dependent DNA ligase
MIYIYKYKPMISSIISDPINTLKKLTSKQIVTVLEQADAAFFNTDETILPDDIYDIVKTYLKNTDPKNPYLKKVGAQVEFNKEKLPYYLGSLDKIKDSQSEITKWINKYNGPEGYIVSEKLDGISCMIYNHNGTTKMYSRGNGIDGQNISHILPHINLGFEMKAGFPKAIRGELIISRKNWGKMLEAGANARNVVAGAIHSKTLNKDILRSINFVAYDVIYPRQSPADALKALKALGVPVVKHKPLSESELSLDTLSTTLQDWRVHSAYEIDGIVVHHNATHNLVTGKNPKYAFAFKTILTQEQAEVIVTDVEWNVSKHRYLKPLVKFGEISLGGVKIKQATGFNAAYIQKHKIGPGARIVIVRSGDVIPHIVSVLKQSANGKAKMPSLPYIWNDTNIDVMLSGEEKNKEQDIQVFSHFMKVLEVDGVKEGVISKLYDAGYDTLSKIIHISIQDLQNVEGFREKSAQKVHDSLQGILQCKNPETFMIASNKFGRGFGDKKIKLITNEYPYIAKNKAKALELTVNDLTKIKGIAETTAKQFIDNLPAYYDFMEDLDIKLSDIQSEPVKQQNKQLSEIFNGKRFVFSGFRNSEYERIIEENGGSILSATSSTTSYLVVKDKSKMTTKVEKAIQLGIKIMSKDELQNIIEAHVAN